MTLLELMVACSILMVLAAVAIPMERVTIKRARENALRYELREMRDAIDRYKDASDKNRLQVKTGTEGYPPDMDTLVNGVDLTSAGAGIGVTAGPNLLSATSTNGNNNATQKIHFLRAVPVDPMTGNKDWTLRSVQDDPDSSSWGGQDVFDVHSSSTATALDGSKYSDW
jgi:general secretion pathway protein G